MEAWWRPKDLGGVIGLEACSGAGGSEHQAVGDEGFKM